MNKQIDNLKTKLQELKLKHLATQVEDCILDTCLTQKPNSQFLEEILDIELK